MRPAYDVVVAGGSISGLLCAREVALSGNRVLVVEEDHEIGTPEHCGGLVSSSGLDDLGVIPFAGTVLHRVRRARITSPDGAHSITIDAKRQNVLCVDRRGLDKQVAHQAQKAGAEIATRTSMHAVTSSGVKIGSGPDKRHAECGVVVDARGAASLVQKDREGAIPSAQYEVYADWIDDGTVTVRPDRQLYPGFFAWVIPSGRGRGRVGVAGRGINAARALESYLERAGGDMAGGSGGGGRRHSVIRKIFAPIWIKGPIKRFHDAGSRVIIVGDAAGQSKPTTAGGIFSSGMGGILAGRAISRHLADAGRSGAPDIEALGSAYHKMWNARFGREFSRQLLARRVLERADNVAINEIIKSASSEALRDISANSDFDFHVSGIARLLVPAVAAKTARSMLSSELRRLLPHDRG